MTSLRSIEQLLGQHADLGESFGCLSDLGQYLFERLYLLSFERAESDYVYTHEDWMALCSFLEQLSSEGRFQGKSRSVCVEMVLPLLDHLGARGVFARTEENDVLLSAARLAWAMIRQAARDLARRDKPLKVQSVSGKKYHRHRQRVAHEAEAWLLGREKETDVFFTYDMCCSIINRLMLCSEADMALPAEELSRRILRNPRAFVSAASCDLMADVMGLEGDVP